MLVRVSGTKIEELRHARGLSQEELGTKAGVSDRTIRAIASGKRQLAHRVTVECLAKVLGTTVDAIAEPAPRKPAKPATTTATPAPRTKSSTKTADAPTPLVPPAPRSRLETLVELAGALPPLPAMRDGKVQVPALGVKEHQDLFTAHLVHVGARFWLEGRVGRQRGTPEADEAAALGSKYGAAARFGLEREIAPGATFEVTVHAPSVELVRELQKLVPKGWARVIVEVVAVPAPAFRFFGSDAKHPWALRVDKLLTLSPTGPAKKPPRR